MKPVRYQNDTCVGSNLKLSLVSNRYPNNNNLNNTNRTTTKEGKDAAVAVDFDFKKLKEKGDLSACNAQAEEKMLAIRERMVELNFKEEFIEKILKEYSTKKIEEKLDLLLIKRNIQSPAGWLMAALKNDYQDVEEERYKEESAGQESQPLRIDSRFRGNDIKGYGNDVNTPEQVSREKALEAIKLIQDNISACISPIPPVKSTRVRENRKPSTEN